MQNSSLVHNCSSVPFSLLAWDAFFFKGAWTASCFLQNSPPWEYVNEAPNPSLPDLPCLSVTVLMQ